MDWTTGRLTMKQMEKALVAAGINPDCSAWTSEEMEKAAEVLDAAARKARG